MYIVMQNLGVVVKYTSVCPQVLNPWIPPTMDCKYSGEKFENVPKNKFEFAVQTTII